MLNRVLCLSENKEVERMNDSYVIIEEAQSSLMRQLTEQVGI